MANTARDNTRLPRLGARTRKGVLVVHIASTGAWLGIDVAMAVVIFTRYPPTTPVPGHSATRFAEKVLLDAAHGQGFEHAALTEDEVAQLWELMNQLFPLQTDPVSHTAHWVIPRESALADLITGLAYVEQYGNWR